MSRTTQLPGLYILDTENRGRAVFCAENISERSLIELCPAIILSKKDTGMIHKTRLHDYYFIWNIEEGSSAIALGFGSLYNHSETPNAEFEIDHSAKEIKIFALRDIPAGEEITMDYVASKDVGVELWFTPE